MEKFTLNIEKGKTGLWFVTSPDIRGLLVSERTLTEALHETPVAMAQLEIAQRLAEADG